MKKWISFLVVVFLLVNIGIPCCASEENAAGGMTTDVYAKYVQTSQWAQAPVKNGLAEAVLDSGHTITVEGAPAGAVSLRVTPIPSDAGGAWDWFAGCIGGKIAIQCVLDIYFEDADNNHIQADGVSITISNVDMQTTVFAVSQDGIAAQLTCRYTGSGTGANGSLSFTAQGNHYYVLAQKSTHRITIENGNGGSVEVSNLTPVSGQKVTILTKPDHGNVVESITVTGKSGAYIQITDNGDGTYHFVQPDEDVTVKVTFRAETESCILNLQNSGLTTESTVWIDGIAYTVQENSEGIPYVEIPSSAPPVLLTYSYNVSSDDRHTEYPTGMQAYRIRQTDTGAAVERLPALDDLLQYSGSSIRITGNKGIRMITSVNQDTRNYLTGNGLEGFKLLEYGTLLAQTSKLGNDPLVLGGENVKSNYAYKKDVADPVFKYVDGLIQYTNVLVGFTDEQCAEDIAMRPYMKLLDENDEEFVIYGGIVYRSIGYIAYQNRNAFQPGSAAYEYVWGIIHNVYGDQYDDEYKK